MNSKERAKLRAIAVNVKPIFQVGKEGVTHDLAVGVLNALKKREIVKISVLENCDFDIKTIANDLAIKNDCEVVQVIGHKIVLYKVNPENPVISNEI
ncbi:RNA-binding protein [Clostridia bacterium]|nr:RNA-binding protein [Clostridia bacterium]